MGTLSFIGEIGGVVGKLIAPSAIDGCRGVPTQEKGKAILFIVIIVSTLPKLLRNARQGQKKEGHYFRYGPTFTSFGLPERTSLSRTEVAVEKDYI